MNRPKEQGSTLSSCNHFQQGSSSQVMLPYRVSRNPLINLSNIPTIPAMPADQSYVYPKYPHGPILSQGCQIRSIHQPSYPNYPMPPPNGFLTLPPNQLSYSQTLKKQDMTTSDPQKETIAKKCKSATKENESENRPKPYYVRKCIGTKWTKEEVSSLLFYSCRDFNQCILVRIVIK